MCTLYSPVKDQFAVQFKIAIAGKHCCTNNSLYTVKKIIKGRVAREFQLVGNLLISRLLRYIYRHNMCV